MPRIFTDIDDTILKDGQPVQRVIDYIDENGEEVVLGQRHLLPLDKVHALVLQRRRPVRVTDQMSGEVLADHQLLEKQAN